MPYVSDFTQFMSSWLEQHPEEQQEKQKGRALWWDKPQDDAATKANAESKVAQKAYPYFQVD